MKIKLFYPPVVIISNTEHRPETLDEFEARVNEFTQSHNVIDIKYQETQSEDDSIPSIMVMYNDTN